MVMHTNIKTRGSFLHQLYSSVVTSELLGAVTPNLPGNLNSVIQTSLFRLLASDWLKRFSKVSRQTDLHLGSSLFEESFISSLPRRGYLIQLKGVYVEHDDIILLWSRQPCIHLRLIRNIVAGVIKGVWGRVKSESFRVI